MEETLARGALRPGDRLPGERDLMSHFSVSRSTVREALALVEDKPQRAPDSVALTRESVAHHAEVFEAVRHADLVQADRLARCTLYEYYASYAAEESKPTLQALIEE